MKTPQDYDGGYYAIKGFAFQIDKAIISVLNDEIPVNQPVHIENIQDVNYSDTVIQVKYKETQDFALSKLKAPIIQLIEDFIKNPTRNYIIYCFFKDKADEINHYTLNQSELTHLLTPASGKSKPTIALNDRISEITKSCFNSSQFINNFRIQFARDYDTQFSQAINLIKRYFSTTDDDISEIYYSTIAETIKRQVMKSIPSDRSVTRELLLKLINNGKNKIFSAALLEKKGEEAYFSIIKKRMAPLEKTNSNAIIIGNTIKNTPSEVARTIIDINQRWLRNANISIVPLTFILSKDEILATKKALLERTIIYNDGFEDVFFNEAIFNDTPLVYGKPVGRRISDTAAKFSFSIKILTIECFKKNLPYIKIDNLYIINNSEIDIPEDKFIRQDIHNLPLPQLIKLF